MRGISKEQAIRVAELHLINYGYDLAARYLRQTTNLTKDEIQKTLEGKCK